MRSGRAAARALGWGTAYQVAEVALAFGAMLVLVRIIAPEEYGRVCAVAGALGLLNAFGFANFAAQALQLPEGEEPDWSAHWSAGLYVQGALALAAHALAGAAWLVPGYRPLAPLLHVAAFGLMLDWPAQLRAAMLRRELAFGRLKLLLGCSVALKLGTTVALAMAGAGAYALVVGNNVATAVPLAADLLLVRRWRPRPGWWRLPPRQVYGRAWRFGLQQSGSGVLASSRAALEAAVLPAVAGYGAMGLLDRARALYATTVARAGRVLLDAAYPLLPGSPPDAFARRATAFAQGVALAVIPAAVFMALEGPRISRLLYGERWVAADPLLAPAAVGAVALALFSTGWTIALAANRLAACAALDGWLAAASVPMLGVAWLGGHLVAYAWALAAAQSAAAVAALYVAAPALAPGWTRTVLVPPAAASLLGAAALAATSSAEAGLASGSALAVHALVYGAVVAGALRILYPNDLAGALLRVPGGCRAVAWLGLPGAGRPRARW